MSDSPKPTLDIREIVLGERLNAFVLPYLHRKTFRDVWMANIMSSIGDHVRLNQPLGTSTERGFDKWLLHTQPGWFCVAPEGSEIAPGARIPEQWFFGHPFNSTLAPEHEEYNVRLPEICGGKWGDVQRTSQGWSWSVRMGPLSSVRHLTTGGMEPNRDYAMLKVREVLAETIARLILQYDT